MNVVLTVAVLDTTERVSHLIATVLTKLRGHPGIVPERIALQSLDSGSLCVTTWSSAVVNFEVETVFHLHLPCLPAGYGADALASRSPATGMTRR